MSTGIIVVIVVVVVLVVVVVAGGMAVMRRRRLRERFGPEYDRLAGEHDSKRKTDTELTERERRVQSLDIRPLTATARASYAGQWTAVQEQFVDMPADAVTAAQTLVVEVMDERGYPTQDHDQALADLSVGHSDVLGRYRAAQEISVSAAAGTASTEDLRQAMTHYRALFLDLLGEPADEPDTQVTGTGPPLVTDDPPDLVATPLSRSSDAETAR
jgi:hypothetical protein